jgi:hypothetical protein
MTQYIFAHEVLMKDLDSKEFGLGDKEYIGVGCLYRYRRFGFHTIYPSGKIGDAVVGDIWEVNDEQLTEITDYITTFGYQFKTESNIVS